MLSLHASWSGNATICTQNDRPGRTRTNEILTVWPTRPLMRSIAARQMQCYTRHNTSRPDGQFASRCSPATEYGVLQTSFFLSRRHMVACEGRRHVSDESIVPQEQHKNPTVGPLFGKQPTEAPP